MPRDKSKIEKSLKKKGFMCRDGDHKYFIYHTVNGEKSMIKTKTSHTPKMKVIPDDILAKMAEQCKLNKEKFLELIDCTLDQTEYEKILVNKKELR